MAVKVFKVKDRDFVEYIEQPLVTDDICAYKIVLETNYDLKGHTIRITAKRSDGVIFEDYGRVSGNNAEYVIKSSIYNVSGEAEIRIIIVDSEGNCLTDKSLVFEVIASHKSGDMQSAADGGKSVADLALSHIYNTDNPHSVTAAQLGLGNVISDLNKKINFEIVYSLPELKDAEYNKLYFVYEKNSDWSIDNTTAFRYDLYIKSASFSDGVDVWTCISGVFPEIEHIGDGNCIDGISFRDGKIIVDWEREVAPKRHRSSSDVYGMGSATYYGHVKLSDSTGSTRGEAGGIAATPYAVKQAYDLANTANTRANDAYDLADDVYYSLYTNGYAGGSEVTADLSELYNAIYSNGFVDAEDVMDTVSNAADGLSEVVQTVSELSHHASGEEYNTGRIWLDGSPIYRRDFFIQVLNTSMQWQDKEISWSELLKFSESTMIIKSNAKGCVGNFYSDSEDCDVSYVDNIDISTTAYGIEWTQDIEYMNSLHIWGYVEYCKISKVSKNNITHKFE